jgi:hypothetical protein
MAATSAMLGVVPRKYRCERAVTADESVWWVVVDVVDEGAREEGPAVVSGRQHRTPAIAAVRFAAMYQDDHRPRSVRDLPQRSEEPLRVGDVIAQTPMVRGEHALDAQPSLEQPGPSQRGDGPGIRSLGSYRASCSPRMRGWSMPAPRPDPWRSAPRARRAWCTARNRVQAVDLKVHARGGRAFRRHSIHVAGRGHPRANSG